MHELGLAQDFWEVIKQKAKENNLKKIEKITLRVGTASGIEEDFLRHSFVDHIFPGTIAEGAELEIIDEPVKARCKSCGKDITSAEEFALGCPFCGSPDIEISAGKDIYLEYIEGIK